MVYSFTIVVTGSSVPHLFLTFTNKSKNIYQKEKNNNFCSLKHLRKYWILILFSKLNMFIYLYEELLILRWLCRQYVCDPLPGVVFRVTGSLAL